jgi:autotransporter-associated beta strand protein
VAAEKILLGVAAETANLFAPHGAAGSPQFCQPPSINHQIPEKMKAKHSLRLFLAGSAAVITTTLPQTVRAETYYWDVNGTTAGFSTVVGAWNGTNQFWNTDATGGGGTLSEAPTAADDLIIPQATTKTGSITVTGTQYASSITFAANVGPTTTITGGTIQLGGTGATSGVFEASSGANAVASALTLNSEVSNFSISNTAAGVLTLSGNITGAAAADTQTLNIGSTSSGGIALSKVIGDGFGGGIVALMINNTSTGATTLSGANTFTGGLTIKAGTVSGTTSANAFGASAGVITLGAGSGSANATLSGGLAGTFPNSITVASGNTGVATITSSAAAVFSGAVTLNSHDLSLSPVGSALTLSGGVTGTGNLILKATGAGVITLVTGSLDHLGTITNSGTGAAANVISATIGTNVTGVVQNSATSQLILSGTNTYTGPTTLSAGTLSVSEAANLGAAASNLVFDGGTLKVTGTTLTNFSGIGHTVVLNAGKTVSFDVADIFTADLALTQGSGGLTKSSAGTLVLNQANSYTGTTTLSGGTLKLQDLGTGLIQTLGALTLAGIDVTLQSDNAGTGVLSTTFGTLTRASGNTANIVLSGGTVGTDNIINLAGAAGFIDKGVFFNGADYAARNTTDGYVRALAYGTDPGTSAADAMAAGTHVKLTASPAARVGDTLLSLNLAGGGVDYPMSSGTLTVPAIIKSGGGVSTISGGTAVTAGTGVELVVRTASAPDQLAISTPVTGTGALTKSGTGTLTLSGVNTYSGATIVSGGTLEIGGAGQLNSGTYAGAISVATGATVKSNSSATQALGGVISGGGGLTKDNTGALTVSAANTFTGGVTLNNGTLKANTSAGALGAGALVLNGGTLDFNHSAALNFGRPTMIAGDVTIISEKNAAGAGVTYTLGTLSIGAYTLNVTGGNVTSVTAGLTFGATTLTGAATFNVTKPAGGGNTQLTIPGGVNNGGYLLTVDGTGAISFAGTANVITGAGGITKNGSGTLFLGAGGATPAHNYTGPTVINGGVVMFYGNKTAGNFTLNNGMLTDYYRNTTAFTGGLGAGDNQIQIYGDSGFGGGNGNSTWRIGASGSALRWGSTYFNPTSLKFLTPNDNMGPSIYGQVTLDNGLDLNGGARTIYVLPATGANAFNSWGKISGIIKDDAGGGSLIKTGGGQLILSAANTFNGVTTNSDGWLTLQHAAALQNSALDTAGSIAGTATAGLMTNQKALTLGGLTGNKDFATVFTTTSGGYGSVTALTLNPGAGVTNSYSGAIANGAADMALIKTGLGTQILAGANTYTGATTVNAGTLVISGSPTGNSAINVAGGTLQLDYTTNLTSKINDSAILTLSGGTLDLKGSGHTEVVDSTTLGAATLSAVTRSSGDAVLALNAITPGYGRLKLGTGGIATTDNLNTNGILGVWATVGGSDWAVNSTNTADGLITAYDAYSDIAAQGSILADGAATNVRINSGGTSGNIALGAATATIHTLLQNTTTAATIGTAGRTLRVNGVLLGSGMEALTIGAAADDGTLSVAAEGGELILINDNAARNLTINAAIADNGSPSALTKLGVGPVILNAANTYSGATTIVAGTLQIGSGGTTGSISATSGVNNNGALIYNRGDALGVSHVISGTGSLTKQGAGTLTLSNANTYTGPTTVSAGTLQIGDGTTSGSIAGTSAVTNNGTLAYNCSDDVSVGNQITGSGSLTKLGAGKLTLTVVPRYTGHTTVSAGTLRLNSPNPNNEASTVTLAASGALLELPFGGTDTVGSFIIGTTQQAVGVYGHTDSGATNGDLGVGVMDAYFAAGTGTLTVTPATGFTVWKTANATSQTIGEDHDHDGVSNGVEYFLGGPNGNTTGFTALPGVAKTGNTISITRTHAADYTGIYGTDFVVETSTTLLPNSWEAETLGGTVSLDGNNVTFTFPNPMDTRKFARLKVNGP